MAAGKHTPLTLLNNMALYYFFLVHRAFDFPLSPNAGFLSICLLYFKSDSQCTTSECTTSGQARLHFAKLTELKQ